MMAISFLRPDEETAPSVPIRSWRFSNVDHTSTMGTMGNRIACWIGWAVIATTVVLPGCRKGESHGPADTRPEAQTLTERSIDLRAWIAEELAKGEKRIVVPEGRYRVQAEHGRHLYFRNLEDVEIIAYDVEMVCTSTVGAITFDGCSNVTIRGLTIDYDPLPFTQGTIVSIAPDKASMVFEVAEGYPESGLEERIQIYDPASGELRRGDARWRQEIEPLGDRRYRVSKAANHRFDPLRDTEQVGDILVTNHRSGGPGSPHAIVLRNCKGMRFNDITLFASPCFGFLEKDCDGSAYVGCKIDRRDPSDDPIKRALPRMRSLNADAFHSKDATKGPAIIACTALYHGDDCVNINGRYHYVSRSDGRQLRVAALDKLGFKAGDPVEFLPFSGPCPPDATVVEIQPDPAPLSAEEEAFIRRLRLDENHRTKLLSQDARWFTLTLDREISLPEGSMICCPSRVGNGFAVTDCNFGHNRSRGILIKASDGRIANNRISHSRMAAVLVTPEYWWMEGGISSDLVVSDNLITGCLETPIQVLAPGGDRKPLPAGAHRNISILNNRIEDGPWPLIRVTSTEKLTIEGNVLPDHPEARPDGEQPKAIELEFCES